MTSSDTAAILLPDDLPAVREHLSIVMRTKTAEGEYPFGYVFKTHAIDHGYDAAVLADELAGIPRDPGNTITVRFQLLDRDTSTWRMQVTRCNPT